MSYSLDYFRINRKLTPITDERAIPPAGRIGETEDLIGSVFVKDGKVSPAAIWWFMDLES